MHVIIAALPLLALAAAEPQLIARNVVNSPYLLNRNLVTPFGLRGFANAPFYPTIATTNAFSPLRRIARDAEAQFLTYTNLHATPFAGIHGLPLTHNLPLTYGQQIPYISAEHLVDTTVREDKTVETPASTTKISYDFPLYPSTFKTIAKREADSEAQFITPFNTINSNLYTPYNLNFNTLRTPFINNFRTVTPFTTSSIIPQRIIAKREAESEAQFITPFNNNMYTPYNLGFNTLRTPFVNNLRTPFVNTLPSLRTINTPFVNTLGLRQF